MTAVHRHRLSLDEQLWKLVSVGEDPRDLRDHEEMAEYVRTHTLAAIKELTEAMDNIGWKPWANSQHFDVQEFLAELVDVQMFLDNLILLAITAGYTPQELEERFTDLMRDKLRIVVDRHRSGTYGGFDGKH